MVHKWWCGRTMPFGSHRKVMTHMTTLCGIEQCITLVYRPHQKKNGLTQHINHSINEKQGKAVAHNQHKWLDLVAVLVWCWDTSNRSGFDILWRTRNGEKWGKTSYLPGRHGLKKTGRYKWGMMSLISGQEFNNSRQFLPWMKRHALWIPHGFGLNSVSTLKWRPAFFGAKPRLWSVPIWAEP